LEQIQVHSDLISGHQGN